jgi:MFS family permease
MTDEKRQRNRVLALLFTGVLMAALDIAIIGPALPAIREAFSIGERAAAWMLTMYVLFNLVGTPLMAKLSDRFGRRSVYVADVGIFALGSLVVALSPTYGWVLVGRATQGLGAGGIFPVASAVIGDVFPPEKRGGALGLIGAVFGIAFILGPMLAGAILLLLSWHWLFLVNVPVALVVMVAAGRLLPSRRAEVVRPFDGMGMVTLAVLLAALAFGLNRLNAERLWQSLASPEVWPFLTLGIALVFVFTAVERRADDPVVRPGLFASRQVKLASALSLGAGLTEAAVVFVPALLVASFGVTMSAASFMLMPIVLALSVGAPVSGRMLDRYGSRVVVLAGTALIAGGMLLVGFFPASLTLFYTAGVLIGLGLASLLGSSLRYVMLAEATAAERGAAQGILTVFISVGQLVGAAVVGAVIGSHGGQLQGYGAAFLMVGVVLAFLTLLSFGLKSRAAERATMRAPEVAASAGGGP